MTTNNQQQALDFEEYDYEHILGNEENALSTFTDSYDEDTYLCDAIMEIADRYTPIYYSELWENGQAIEEYINEAIDHGLVEVSDITKILQAGFYQYFRSTLYNNLVNLIYNTAVDHVNRRLIECEGHELENIDFDLLEQDIRTAIEDINSDNRFIDIKSAAIDIVSNHIEA